MSDPIVSLVMPVYRSRPDHLRTSLTSVLNQSFDDLEILLVIDESGGIHDSMIQDTINEFRDDHRIRTITRAKKLGYCSALNAGIRNSAGQFIARLDSDDYSDASRIEKQMDALHSSEAVLVGTWANIIDEDGKEIGHLRTPVSASSIRYFIMLHNPFVHSSIIIKKQVISEIGMYNEAFEGAEDYEFYLRAVAKGSACVNIPEYLTYLRQTRESITRGRGWRKTRERYFIAKCEGVIQLKYRRAFDLLCTIASPAALLVTPAMGEHLKRVIGWYSSYDANVVEPLQNRQGSPTAEIA